MSYGPQPGPVVDWVRDNCRWVVAGNHDRALALGIDPQCQDKWRPWALATLAWHRSLLREDQIIWLRDLPAVTEFEFGGARFVAGHASPTGELTGYRPPEEICALARRYSDVDVVLTGHTHEQWLRRAGPVTCINPGSVGLPRTLRRACAAVWDDGRVESIRAPLEWPVTRQQLAASPLPPGVAELADTLMAHVWRRGAGPGPHEFQY